MASIVIQDACVLINLLASGRFEDIAIGCGFRFAIASVVSREALYLHNAESLLQLFIGAGDGERFSRFFVPPLLLKSNLGLRRVTA